MAELRRIDLDFGEVSGSHVVSIVVESRPVNPRLHENLNQVIFRSVNPEYTIEEAEASMVSLTVRIGVLSFGDWLREKRRAARLTQDELAELVGCSKTYISSLERDARHTTSGGEVIPSKRMISALAAALKIRVGEIVAELYDIPERDRPEFIGASDNFREGLTEEQAQAFEVLVDQLRRANEGRQ